MKLLEKTFFSLIETICLVKGFQRMGEVPLQLIGRKKGISVGAEMPFVCQGKSRRSEFQLTLQIYVIL